MGYFLKTVYITILASSEFPNAPTPVGNMVALMDVPLQQIEQDRQKRVISGSQQEGFNVPATKTVCTLN